MKRGYITPMSKKYYLTMVQKIVRMLSFEATISPSILRKCSEKSYYVDIDHQ